MSLRKRRPFPYVINKLVYQSNSYSNCEIIEKIFKEDNQMIK